MSALVSPDEAPFVFGAYATHQTEVTTADRVEVEAADVPRAGECDRELAAVLSQLPTPSVRRRR